MLFRSLLLCTTQISKDVDILSENVYKNEENVYISEQSKVKESKVKESRVEESKENKSKSAVGNSPPPLTKDFLVEKYGLDNYSKYESKVINWVQRKNIKSVNILQRVAEWLEQDFVQDFVQDFTDSVAQGKAVASRTTSSFDVDDLDRRAFEEFM